MSNTDFGEKFIYHMKTATTTDPDTKRFSATYYVFLANKCDEYLPNKESYRLQFLGND